MIRITAKKDGFRRCGVAHPKTATEYPDGRFSPAELETLRGDPMLVVEIVAEDNSDKGKQYVMNATDTVEKIRAAATVAELDELVKDDDRKSVIAAAAKRCKELTSQ